jgi:TetR/AcrR family transcriptional repressor of nem operon
MTTDIKQARRHLSHERILDAAAGALCRDGYAGVGVANVMNEAGLTHGGFYAHFNSRDALLAEAVEHAGLRSMARMRERLDRRVADGASPLHALIDEYLSDLHVVQVGAGCPVAALGADLHRGDPDLRAVASRRVSHLVEMIEQVLPAGSTPGAALVIAGTMVGAVQMARVFEGDAREAMLRACRTALIDRYASK